MRRYEAIDFSSSEVESLRKLSTFDYSKIPSKVRLGTAPYDSIVIYKGAQRHLETRGLPSHAIELNLHDRVTDAKKIVETGTEDAIEELIDAHTSGNSRSAFLSATLNPEMAQVFAPTDYAGKAYTIYKLRIPANRCILDAFNTGNSGASGEVLVLGLIFPDEITATKIDNGFSHSELTSTTTDGISIVKWVPDFDSTNVDVKNPNNWLESLRRPELRCKFVNN